MQVRSRAHDLNFQALHSGQMTQAKMVFLNKENPFAEKGEFILREGYLRLSQW